MTAPHFTILTQKELTIDLSRPAMQWLIAAIANGADITPRGWNDSIQCEVDNFTNTLQNLLERSEPKPENSDLIGE
jgi:hypothetical protein